MALFTNSEKSVVLDVPQAASCQTAGQVCDLTLAGAMASMASQEDDLAPCAPSITVLP
jgi:hypothetical protein